MIFLRSSISDMSQLEANKNHCGSYYNIECLAILQPDRATLNNISPVSNKLQPCFVSGIFRV
jgi:hypothetical protein